MGFFSSNQNSVICGGSEGLVSESDPPVRISHKTQDSQNVGLVYCTRGVVISVGSNQYQPGIHTASK